MCALCAPLSHFPRSLPHVQKATTPHIQASGIEFEFVIEHFKCPFEARFLRRDKQVSIAYSEELIFPISATLQSTDRHYGIVGQERCHFQRDS
jgi:hypothetical protein